MSFITLQASPFANYSKCISINLWFLCFFLTISESKLLFSTNMSMCFLVWNSQTVPWLILNRLKTDRSIEFSLGLFQTCQLLSMLRLEFPVLHETAFYLSYRKRSFLITVIYWYGCASVSWFANHPCWDATISCKEGLILESISRGTQKPKRLSSLHGARSALQMKHAFLANPKSVALLPTNMPRKLQSKAFLWAGIAEMQLEK